jgi:hypothetical protein
MRFIFLLSKFFNEFTLTPVIHFYLKYLPSLFTQFISNHFYFWNVSNYADAYWFLYSNKNVIYEVRHL